MPAFDWDDGNREKCQSHGVSIADIERVLDNTETYLVPDDKNSIIEPRFIAIGRNATGRFTLVIFTPREQHGRMHLRPISARYMHKKEIAKYEKEIAGAKDRRRS